MSTISINSFSKGLMAIKANKSSLLSAIFLVSGTSIGGGMLTQPIVANNVGFIPASLMLLLSWAFMTSTALVLLEVCLWSKEETHIISLAKKWLGTPGKYVTWVLFLFIACFSCTAYISGGGKVIEQSIYKLTNFHMPLWICYAVFALLFSIAIELGQNYIGRINTILFLSLCLAYFVITILGLPVINITHLTETTWNKSYLLLPILFTSFSFQIIVPNLVGYLNRDVRKIRLAIIIGTSTSFLVYFIWNAIILGTTPQHGLGSLSESYANGTLPNLMNNAKNQLLFNVAVQYFSFFALTTSFIGVSWGLFEFLADGLKIKKIGKSRLLLWGLVVIPPFIMATYNPRAFISALETTGGFGDSILNGIIPVVMFWIGYFHFRNNSNNRILKQKIFLVGLLVFSCIIIGLQTLRQFNILTLS